MTKTKLPEGTQVNPETVAAWMLKELEEHDGVLYQDDAVSQIADLFGEQFAYVNDEGSNCIDKRVLTAFRKITEQSVIWSRGDRMWRKREPGDGAARQQE